MATNTHYRPPHIRNRARNRAHIKVDKMPIRTDANIDAGVNVTIDENESYTHVDETQTNTSIDDSANANLINLKQVQVQKHDCTYAKIIKRKRKRDKTNDCPESTMVKTTKSSPCIKENNNDISCRNLFSVNQEERHFTNGQRSNAKEIQKNRFEEGFDMLISENQSAYNPDQVVHNKVEYSALSQPVLDLVPENLVPVDVPTMGPLDIETSFSARKLPFEFSFPVLHGQTNQENLMHNISRSNHEVNRFKPELVIDITLDQSAYAASDNTPLNVHPLSGSPQLPTYEEALKFPTLGEYLKDNPITEEIRKVLDFKLRISMANKVSAVPNSSTPRSSDFSQRNVIQQATNSEGKLQTKLSKRSDCVSLDSLDFLSRNSGNMMSNKSYSLDFCETTTPPYTYLLPKLPKPPDKKL